MFNKLIFNHMKELKDKMTHHISNIIVDRVKDFLRDLVDDQPELNIEQTEDIIQLMAEDVDESYRRKLCEDDKFRTWFLTRPCNQYHEKVKPYDILFNNSLQELTPAQHGYCCNAVEQSLNFEKIANNFVTKINLLGDIDYVWVAK